MRISTQERVRLGASLLECIGGRAIEQFLPAAQPAAGLQAAFLLLLHRQ